MALENIPKELSEMINLAMYNRDIQEDLRLYKFFLPKHNSQISIKQLPKRFNMRNIKHLSYIKKIDEKKMLISPLVWIKKEALILYNKHPFYIRSTSFKEYPVFLLVEETQVPFYLLGKYSGTRKIEYDIFKLPRILQKNLNAYRKKSKVENRKKYRKAIL
jgi:hypothetical protein